ncbi:MAG TPA: NADH-quinone oxidoreductase subunit L [Fimbriimonadaceae bacterium]|nr:NADH-quinone oxidoreductase subunit L [Fimbriimonadaceae bacterium]HRJ32529.1 NADH-quinone oxidoreductase subunit L [Fimbriimonadaceae bacterium]
MPNVPLEMIWWVLGLPLIGFLLQAFLGKKIIDTLGHRYGKKIVGTMAVLPIAAAFLLGIGITANLAQFPPGERNVVLTLFSWIEIMSIKIPFEVVVDPLSMTMVLIITGIGSLIHLYATGYMGDEKDYSRFFTYLNLFIACMLILVLGNNLALLFIGWEGVGVCSYLLIGFWFKDLNNSRAANKAFIVNRIGDVGLTLGMFILVLMMAGNAERLGLTDGRWLSYDVLLPNMVEVFKDQPFLTATVALLLFVGACGKSAQFPLYLWLPDAMAGPTPVSALIHAATMVTAGVFLLNRMSVLFELSPFASAIIAIIGAFTALFAALIAFGQTDIKKVLAYSTVSQLGFMFIACGAGAYWAGMFHVTTHAFFKALLFLGAGAVIYAMAHEQDMRKYGNLLKYLPITGACMLVAWVAISGLAVPFLFGFAGFYSKETILGGALAGQHAIAGGINLGMIAGWVGLLVAMLTAFYMTRMTWMTFFGKQERWRLADGPSHDHGDSHHADHEAHDENAHHAHEDHGPDVHGFFYTEAEMARRAELEEHDHHHDIEPTHEPKEVGPAMWIPLAVLGVLSVIGGWFLYSGDRFKKWLYPNGLTVLPPEVVPKYPEWETLLMFLSIGAALAGVLLGWHFYKKGLPEREGWDLAKWHPFRRAAANQFHYDQKMVDGSLKGGAQLGEMLNRTDKGFIDGMVNGIAWLTGLFGNLLKRFQTGNVRWYAAMMLLGGIGVLGYLWWVALKLGGA